METGLPAAVVSLDGWCVEVSVAQLASAMGTRMWRGIPEQNGEGCELVMRSLRAIHLTRCCQFVPAISTWPLRPKCDPTNPTNPTNLTKLWRLGVRSASRVEPSFALSMALSMALSTTLSTALSTRLSTALSTRLSTVPFWPLPLPLPLPPLYGLPLPL